MYYSYLSLSGFSPQLFSMKPCEILSKKYNKRIGDSLCCGWREKFCGKVEERGFQRGRQLRSRLSIVKVFRYVAFVLVPTKNVFKN